MQMLDTLPDDPLSELPKASRIIREDSMLELAIEMDETDIELQFGDVDAEHWFCPGGQLLV